MTTLARITRHTLILATVLGLGSCANDSTSNTSEVTYSVGGTVSGLAGSGLVLRDNGGDDLVVSANGTFTFAGKRVSGTAYSVTVLTQPSSPAQSCVVTGGSGTMAGANLTTVAITCTTNTYSVGGTVTGLAGSGLVLRINGGDDLAVSGNRAFTFGTKVASGAAYGVTVLTQPSSPAQSCAVTGGSGTMASANVRSVAIVCTTAAPQLYTVGGTVTGLTGAGLMLRDNGGDDLAVSANGTFTFATPLSGGAAYSVTVSTQPTGPTQSCEVTNGNGTVIVSNIATVLIACRIGPPQLYGVAGTISGLAGSGLVLRDNGGDDLAVSANGTFSFATPVASGADYSVTVFSQPTNPAQACVVTGGSGTVTPGVAIFIFVACTTNGSSGTLRVTVATTGPDAPASDTVWDQAYTLVPSNGAVSIAVPSGAQTVYLAVAHNCTVTSANYLTVTVATGLTTNVAFSVTCVANGSLRVTVATTGTDVPATYGVYESTGFPGYIGTVPSNGTGSFAVGSGDHTVFLNVARNCSVTSANSLPVTVAAGAPTDVGFSVTCSGPGAIQVTVATTGTDVPATYSVRIARVGFPSVRPKSVPSNGVVSFPATVGNYTVTLTVPLNCAVNGHPPFGRERRTVTVASEATTNVSFSVTCGPPATLRVTAATTGPNAPTAYTVGVDPAPDAYGSNKYSVEIPSNGTVSTILPPSSHIVQLQQVPLNCTVTSPDRVPVTLTSGETTDLGFTVACR